MNLASILEQVCDEHQIIVISLDAILVRYKILVGLRVTYLYREQFS